MKLENVLLVKAGDNNLRIAKICDFGYSKNKLLDSPEKSRVGSPAYFAPEVIDNVDNVYDGMKVDLWACGIMLYTMLYRCYPFSREEDAKMNSTVQIQKMLARIKFGDWQFPEEPKFSEGAQQLLKGLIQNDPTQRFSIEDVYNHRWFNVGLPPGLRQLNDNYTAVQPCQGIDNIKYLVEQAKSVANQKSTGNIYDDVLNMQDSSSRGT